MSEPDLRANPYVGLRPFFADDSLYFYGREQQTTELLGILRNSRFLGVVGSSGSGKSSLVRAGLLPGLLGGFLVQDRDRWRTVQIKPGDAPIGNLAAGLLEATRHPAAPDPPEALEALEREIREGHTDAVVEFLKPRLEGNANLFLLVDQFEEIFAFASGQDRTLPVAGRQRRSGFFSSTDVGDDRANLEPARRKEQARRKAEAADFVDLLLKLAEQRELPIYVALTMRTDFLGDCDLFHGLPEALNRGRYLVPRMTREELRDAVECPALLLSAEIAPRLLDHVLNELGDRFDRLPVLQHALLRTWDAWQSDGGIGPIDLRHFESAGGLEGALRKDAEAALEGLDLGVTERVFKRLTDTDLSERRIRSPARLTQLVAAAGAKRGTVEGVVRQFEEQGRSFVHGSADGKRDDPRVDISHESLIRQWDRLRDWVDEERQSRDEYRELVTKARKRERGEGALLQDPELQVVIDWWAKASPSSGWAQRYSSSAGDFDSAERFLNDSAAARDAELAKERQQAEAERMAKERELEQAKALAEAQRQRANEQEAARVRQRRYGRVLAALLVLAVATGGYGWWQKVVAGRQRDLNVTQQLAVEANSEIGRDLELAFLFGAAANREHPNRQTRESLRRALLAQPNLRGFLSGHTSAVRSVAFSPDSTTLASASEDSTIILWDLPSRQPRKTLRGHTDYVTSVAFSPDGKTLASGSQDWNVILWNVASGEPTDTLHGHDDYVRSVAFSPDGKTLASASEDKTIILWDLRSRQPRDPLKGHTDYVTSVAFSPDGQWIASGSEDQTVILWKVASGELFRRLKGHSGSVTSVAFGSTGRMLASASDDQTVRIWDLTSRSDTGVLLRGAEGPLTSAAFSPGDRTLAAASVDGTVTLWDRENGPWGDPLKGHQDAVRSVAFSPDGKTLASAGEEGAVILWDVSIGQRRAEPLNGHADFVRSVAFSPDSTTLASASEDSSIILWDLRSRQPRNTLKGHTDYVTSVTFSPDGTSLASASRDSTVILWDAHSGRALATLRGHMGSLTSVAFSPDGSTLASASEDSTIILWDLRSRQPRDTLEGYFLTSLAFSPNGRILAVASRFRTVTLWDLQNGRVDTLRGHKGGVMSVAFSHDGKTLASSSDDGKVILWSVDSLKPLGGPLRGHRDMVSSVAFSPNDLTLASASHDNTIILWDVRTRQPIGEPVKGHGSVVTSVAFSPDGRTLASGSWDRTVLLWDPILWEEKVDEWLLKACHLVNRNLTPNEWEEHMGKGAPYRTSCPKSLP